MEVEDDVGKKIKGNNTNTEIDSSAGALVWVRRRNGSWWPGRVLGFDELPANRSNSTRSGTPIMLLGKEDGSVDWFNLEKSTRIKAFRCGEYDECIERAKDRALRSNRKPANTRKYVRREYAILHALRLEEAHSFEGNQKNDSLAFKVGKKFEYFDPQSNKIGRNNEPVYADRKNNRHKKSSQKLSQSGISFEHRGKLPTSNMQYLQKKRWRTPNDSEDDTTEGMKRMRDLQDLGGMILKREPKGHVRTKGFQDLAITDIASLSDSDFDNDLSSEKPINSSRDSCSSLKRKRPHGGQAHDSFKKKCRRRSLSEVWMGASKAKITSHYPQVSISEESFLQGVTNLKAKINNPISRDFFIDNPTSSKKIGSTSTINGSPECSGTSSEEALLNTHESTGNAASGSTDFPSGTKDRPFSGILESLEDDLSDSFIDVPVKGGENATDLLPAFEIFPSTKLKCTEENQLNHSIKVGLVSRLNEGLGEACSTGSSSKLNSDRLKNDMGASEWHTKGKRNARHLTWNKNVDSEIIVDKTDQKETMNSASDESLISDSSCQRIKCMSVAEVCDEIEDKKPKISSPNARNSILSSMESGAPLPPRKIRLPSRYRVSEQNDPCLYDVELRVQSNYQGQRVPLVSLMSKFNGKAIVGHPVTVEILASGHRINKLPKGRSNTITRSQAKGKKSVFSPGKKIRRLSSFVLDRKDEEDGKKMVVEKIGGPIVSCIPLKLVFSRLNEALSSSARALN